MGKMLYPWEQRLLQGELEQRLLQGEAQQKKKKLNADWLDEIYTN